MKKLIAGNWKMNNTVGQSIQLATSVVGGLQENPTLLQSCDFAVFPPFLHLDGVKQVLSETVALGAQTCSSFGNGAFTGDVSADMLSDIGCKYVILGHSERRSLMGESSADISRKMEKAHGSGLITILCVGETEGERDEGLEKEIVAKQLSESLPAGFSDRNTVIAYEPVWAIGTGKTATTADIAEMHGFIRQILQERLDTASNLRILYGGSVKPANAADIFKIENVNGALIGGASLKAEDFLGIAGAA